jgi:hypothetical protein
MKANKKPATTKYAKHTKEPLHEPANRPRINTDETRINGPERGALLRPCRIHGHIKDSLRRLLRQKFMVPMGAHFGGSGLSTNLPVDETA